MYDSFYVDLLSNASIEGNTVANFKNKIQLMKPLDGEWEVALVEISYTKSWKNLRDCVKVSIDRAYYPPEPFPEYIDEKGYFPVDESTRKGIIRAGYYENAFELCNEIEREFVSLGSTIGAVAAIDTSGLISLHKKFTIDKYPKFYFDEIVKQIYIEPGRSTKNEMLLPQLNEEVATLLGFDNYSTWRPNMNSNDFYYANRPADINTCLKTLFIYSDVVEPQSVGGVRVKLLRTVEVPPEIPYGQQVNIIYDRPHYVQVLIKDFEHIIINIRDDINETIPFMFGRSRVKLHFRKCFKNSD